MVLPTLITSVFFARGGGGGSGGGGGGGGSGGGGGGGGIFLLGYVPMHFLGAFFRRSKDNKVAFGLLQATGWIVSIIYAIILGWTLGGIGVFAGIFAPVGMGAGLYGWFGKLRTNKRAEAALTEAAASDGAWDKPTLMQYTAQIFEKFQADWSKADTASMQAYLTPWYYYHVSLMMEALKQAKRVNQVSDVKILQQAVEGVYNADDNSQDMITIGFNAQVTDQLIDTRDQKMLFTDKSPFVEYWNFQRDGNTWRLSGIDQGTANLLSANAAVRQFAAENKFCYSLDWGWLLLPRGGQLFGSGKFGTSDINNHVIGTYHDILIQIYTYTSVPAAQNKDQYLVAQVQLPKSYGDILVRHRKGFASKWFGGVKGLDRIEMEWPDFNKKYEVFSSTGEGPTSFELLHPVFMETLEAAPFEVNLEVVDNVVYFYTKETALKPEHYQAMLGILQEAFKQMRM